MTRGRPVDGGRRLNRCEGSKDAKFRAETVLAYLSRSLSADEACERLGIGPSRFHEIVAESLQGLVQVNEPRSAGRPRETTEADEQVRALESKVTDLEHDLKLAKLLSEYRWVPYFRKPPTKKR